MSVEDQAKRIEEDINARAAALMAGPEIDRGDLLARAGGARRLGGGFRSRDPIPLPPADDRAEILRALASELSAEWEWTVVETIGGDAEFLITGHRRPDLSR